MNRICHLVFVLSINSVISQQNESHTCFKGTTRMYNGTLNVTESGLGCQAWSSQMPHTHKRNYPDLFPADASVEDAKNYCRDTENEGMVWCYTLDPNTRWEYCNLELCPNQRESTIPTDSKLTDPSLPQTSQPTYASLPFYDWSTTHYPYINWSWPAFLLSSTSTTSSVLVSDKPDPGHAPKTNSTSDGKLVSANSSLDGVPVVDDMTKNETSGVTLADLSLLAYLLLIIHLTNVLTTPVIKF